MSYPGHRTYRLSDVAIGHLGLDHYSAELPHGEGYSVTVPDCSLHYEFDLEFYIRTVRLHWIAPGYQSIALRNVTEDCPYLVMEGHRYTVGIRNGDVWNSLLDGEPVGTSPVAAA